MIGSVDDVLLDEPRVTAEAVVLGLVRYGAAGGDGTEAEILAAVPEGWGEAPVCVKVRTRDGLYSGRASFAPPPGWTGGDLAAMNYTTERRKLFDYPDDAVAVLATPGDCDAPVAELAAATWQAPEGATPEGAAHLLLNSFRADEVYLIVDGTEVACEPIDQGSRASFDTRCAIDQALLAGGADIVINRLRGGSADLPLTVRAAGP